MKPFDFILVYGGGTALIAWLFFRWAVRRRSPSRAEWVVMVIIVAIGAALLIPPRQEPTIYYGGHSYGAWMNQLIWDEDLERRKEAAKALGEILRGEQRHRHCVIISALGRAGAVAQPAIPALKELLQDEDADLRKQAIAAIQQIDPEEYHRITNAK